VQQKILKADPFGTVSLTSDPPEVVRDTDTARWWARAVARHLASREARALIVLNALTDIPKLRSWNGRQLHREWLDGLTMHAGRPQDPKYFSQALRLLRKMHRHGIAHNDLAKEANCLVLGDGLPAFIDFQLSVHAPRRGFLFRQLAREDLRHLLKHKAYYCPDCLTAREQNILANPSICARLWTKLYKPVYLWFTRSILGWPEREGANERVNK
jgi:RIO-like serine/threonine protein kinase